MFIQELRNRMRRIRAKPTAHHAKKTPFTFKNLQWVSHVFVRDETTRHPLQPPYFGPFEALARPNERLHTTLIKDKACNISTERLKPAYLPTAEEEEGSTSQDNLPSPSSPTPLRTFQKTIQKRQTCHILKEFRLRII